MLLGGWSYHSDVGNTCCTLLPCGWVEWDLRQPACPVGLHSTATASTVSAVTTPQVLIAIHGLHTHTPEFLMCPMSLGFLTCSPS